MSRASCFSSALQLQRSQLGRPRLLSHYVRSISKRSVINAGCSRAWTVLFVPRRHGSSEPHLKRSFESNSKIPAKGAAPPVTCTATDGTFEPPAPPRNALSDAGAFIVRSSSQHFLVYLLAACSFACWQPDLFNGFKAGHLSQMLQIIMFSMGVTLRINDFKSVFSMPGKVLLGFLSHYAVLPALALLIGPMCSLSVPLQVGLVLCATCPSAAASNFMAMIGRGDVALSVVTTACSYLAASLFTPVLTKLLVGQLVPVSLLLMAKSTIEVVLGPVLIGVALNQWLPSVTTVIKRFSPVLACWATCLCIATIVAQNKLALIAAGLPLIGSVFLLHIGGFFAGYGIGKVTRQPERITRTVSLQTGTVSAALGVVLAKLHFGDPLIGLPSAISAVFMLVIGTSFASGWQFLDNRALRPKRGAAAKEPTAGSPPRHPS